MTNPIPRIGPDGTIRCMNHPELTAAALQIAGLASWSDAANVMKDTPLLVIAPIENFNVPFARDPRARGLSHAIFWAHTKRYSLGNASLGMCAACAYKFWEAMRIPPLYINQHAIFSNHVTIARTTVKVDFEPHTYQMMRIETQTKLSNKIELVCPECIDRRYFAPYLLELEEYAYE